MDNFLFIKLSEFLKPKCKLCNKQDSIDYYNLCIALNVKENNNICKYHTSEISFKKILNFEIKKEPVFYHDDNDILKKLLKNFKNDINHKN